MPYGAQVLKVLEALKSIKIEMICPSHGLAWRRKEDIAKILSLYQKWANYEPDNKVIIVYDTMWHSTEKMALKLYELLNKEDVKVKLANLKTNDISDVVTDIMLSKAVCLGSPILNNKIFPSISGFLTYLKGLKPKNRYGFTFGSYGWSKAGFSELEAGLKEAGIELLAEGRYINYVPDGRELDNLKDIVIKIKSLLKKEQL
jgi:flavorubredoxin